MYAYIYTFGCKVNQVESEKIINDFADHGLTVTSDIGSADVVILNSCAVTDRAESKFRSMIKKIRNHNPEATIAVTGCAVEKDRDKLKDIGADIVVTNVGKADILDYIADKKDFTKSVFEPHGFIDAENMSMASRTRAFVKIQDGCDSHCAYCIIPSLRGLPVSRKPESVLKEIKNLIDAGYKEIVPVGIHVGKYGADLREDTDLPSLITEILKLEGDFRIRLTSIEVNELTEKMINLLVSNQNKICRHYHIPLQSGSTRTLEHMNRCYTAREYVSKLNTLKEMIPGCTLGADVIAGFPGETEEDFAESIKTIKQSGLDYLHVFSYSDRTGTKASAMMDKIPSKVKSARSKALRKIADELKYESARKCIDKNFRVLTQKDGTGITDNYFTVIFEESVEPNIFLDVLITHAQNDGTLKGVINV